jgi:hypothetical protein
MVGIDIDYIPSILLGNKRYTHYPIRRMERLQAEQIVSNPGFLNKIILRISNNSQQANPNAYYVATYYVNEHRMPVNFIITRQHHQSHNGNLVTILPSNLENYELLIVNHCNSFSDTVITELNE